MRFNIIFNSIENHYDFVTYKDLSTDIILPLNVKQDVHYPIPNELIMHIKQKLDVLLETDYILKETKNMNNVSFLYNDMYKKNINRQKIIDRVRKNIHPLIIEKCVETRNEYPEFFI